MVHSTPSMRLNDALHNWFSRLNFSTHDNDSTILYSLKEAQLLDNIKSSFSYVDDKDRHTENEKKNGSFNPVLPYFLQ